MKFFPLFFGGLWLFVTTFLGLFCGWYGLAARYPNRDEQARLTLRWQSGQMGLGVSMSGILTLSACPSGLRVSVWRIFGPFSRPFFVPWEDIRVADRQVLFQSLARLGFGRPEVGVLSVSSRAWERLARAGHLEPNDTRVLPPTSNASLAKSKFLQWLVITTGAASFYYFVPRLQHATAVVPLAVCILFPGIFFGIVQIVRYFGERRNSRG